METNNTTNNAIETAVLPLKASAIERARTEAEKIIARCEAELIAAGMDLNTAALNDWKRPEFESAICYCASLADGRCDFCTGTRALTVFPTTMNPLCRVVAAPTDPKWKADYDAFQLRRNHPVFRNMPYVADNDLCSIQCAHHSQGFTLAEVVHTIYGFGFRTVHAGGIPFGPKFTTYTAAEKWIVETWYAASPNNREVIDRFNLAARAKAEQKPEGR